MTGRREAGEIALRVNLLAEDKEVREEVNPIPAEMPR